MNGTGATKDIAKTSNPLLRDLFATGMVRPDPLRPGSTLRYMGPSSAVPEFQVVVQCAVQGKHQAHERPPQSLLGRHQRCQLRHRRILTCFGKH